MKIIVVCECSGRVRDAFIKQGHDAISCDLKDTRSPGPHLKMDMFEALCTDHWDLAILHHECTFVANCGNRWYGQKSDNFHLRLQAIKSIERLWALAKKQAKALCLENPVGVLSTMSTLGKSTQIVQPWQFGHGEKKATCFWLHNLPKLKPTNIVDGRYPRVHREPPTKDPEERRELRSITYQGIADAMAEQWGSK